MKEQAFGAYLADLDRALKRTVVTIEGNPATLEEGVQAMLDVIKTTRQVEGKLMWMGNGGSAAIASHEANDFLKNGNCRSMAFHEPSTLTCISNDFGYEHYFEEMIRRWGEPGDVAVFISSSGNSENVVRGAIEATRRGVYVVAFSGFKPDNKLKPLAELSFYVPSMEYGYVELSHQVICHAVLDFLFREDQEQAKVAGKP